MLAALLLPVWRRDPIHLIDVWDPGRVLATMLEESITSGNGATYFLISLLDHPDYTDAHRAAHALHRPRGLRRARGGGGAVRGDGDLDRPQLRVHRAPVDHRHDPRRAPTRSGSTPTAARCPASRSSSETRTATLVAVGQPGEIWSKGPDCFVGYTDPALTAAAFDDDGWFGTGDVGVLDADGYLCIVDRKKDIIIRGGENVSALEVEEQLLRLPGVAEVAVVAAPDARLGEHGCAFVRMHEQTRPPTLPDLRDHLERSGLARQKWPEEIRPIEEFPRTASGKVQKFVLRQQLRHDETSPSGGGSGRLAEIAGDQLTRRVLRRAVPHHPAAPQDHRLVRELEGPLARTARRAAPRRPRCRAWMRAVKTMLDDDRGARPSDISSAISSRGGAASTRARLSICCSPPESVPAWLTATLGEHREGVEGPLERQRPRSPAGDGVAEPHPQVLEHAQVREDGPAPRARTPGPGRSSGGPASR